MAGWEIPERRGRLMRKTIELNRWFSIAMFESEGNRSLSMADAGAANNRVPPKVYHDFPVYKWLLLEKKPSHFQTHTHIIIISPLLLVQFPMFVGRISPVSEVPKYDIKSVTYPNYIPSNLVYFVDYICNIIYIYVEYYIHIYLDYSKKHH